MFEKIVSAINDIVWSPLLVILLIFAGLFFSYKTGFVQVRRFGLLFKSLFVSGTKKKGEKKGISSFEAFCVALSGRVGTGNIVGVATAIALGGPGAVFWMWVIAFFGASTAFIESTLSQIYKFRHETGFRGGPSTYIEKGMKKKWLAVLFSVVTVISCGVLLTSVQANGMSVAMGNSYGISPLTAGIILALILALVIVGGAKSIARVASLITPFMALAYVIMSLIIIGLHIDQVPSVLGSIFTGAFGIKPVAGGILGSTISMGVKRGIFSNEAGQGGGAIASASAEVSHPVRQGFAQSFSVYVDTLLVCTATALMILCSGTYNIFDAKTGEMLVGYAPQLGNNYVGFTQSAVDSVFSGFGGQFVSIALFFFVFTTIMAYYFYSESSIMYVFSVFTHRNKRVEKVLVWLLRLFILCAVVFGAVRETSVIWMLGDIGVGLMAWINIIALFALYPKAIKALKDFERQLREGKKDPDYHPTDIGLPPGVWE